MIRSEGFLTALLDMLRRRPDVPARSPVPAHPGLRGNEVTALPGSGAGQTFAEPADAGLVTTPRHSGAEAVPTPEPALSPKPALALCVPHDDIVVSATLRTEQDIALTVDEHCARLWWLSSGEPIRQYCNPTTIFRSAALSRDYTRVVIGSFTGDISLWDVESGQVTVASRPGVGVPVNSVAFNADDTQVLSATADGLVQLWDVSRGRPVQEIRQRGAVAQAHLIEPDGVILTDDGACLRLWDRAGACVRIMDGHLGEIRCSALNPARTQALSGAEDRTVRLWDLKTGHCRLALAGHDHWVLAVAFGPDGRYAASGGRDNTVRLWDLASGRCAQVFEGHTDAVRAIAFGADGRTLLSVGNDTTARVWTLPGEAGFR